MPSNTIDALLLQKMFLAAAKRLDAKKEWINELNVFPVPDGDTGTNMTMTIMSAAKEVAGLSNVTMENLAKAISSGSLRGARGNSGVILSQLFRGFTRRIKTVQIITVQDMTEALVNAKETAYKAVMKPKEGTILTVARGIAEKAQELSEVEELSMEEFLRALLEHGEYVLNQTPEMLPVLKQAGVVDSGGQGLMQVLRGGFDAYMGREVDIDVVPTAAPKVDMNAIQEIARREALKALQDMSAVQVTDTSKLETADIKFGYCTEFIVNLEEGKAQYSEPEFKAFLESIGDSIVCVSDDDIVKVHVHTNDPGLAIQKGLSYGSLSKMKIDNMREEHNERLIRDAEKIAAQQKAEEEAKKEAQKEPAKEYAFISVSAGAGLSEIFKGVGVDYIIEGGQTMNPSTEDVLNAISKLNAKNVFILPNNKNIILAAEQAKSLVEDCNVIVVPTKTIPQGITAAINFSPDRTPEENEETMREEIANVKTAQITYAVRNTFINDLEIHEDDIMGIGDDGILAAGKDIAEITEQTIAAMMDEDASLISVYYGKDVSEEEANALVERLEELYPALDVELNEGGQPVYYYILSVE